MNTTFYLAIDRIPLGIVVAVSFTGPIAVAAWHSRTRRHALGVGLVALGILALVHPGLAGDRSRRSRAGARERRHVGALHRRRQAPHGRLVAPAGARRRHILGSLLLVPGAAATGGLPLAHIHEFAFLAAVGAIGAGLPYLVELFVMQRVTTRAFSVLQALYPAAGVAVGVIGLHQRLRPVELGGVVLVTCASALALESGGWRRGGRRARDGTARRLISRSGRVPPATAKIRAPGHGDQHEAGRPGQRQDPHDQDAADDVASSVRPMILAIRPTGRSGGAALTPGG